MKHKFLILILIGLLCFYGCNNKPKGIDNLSNASSICVKNRGTDLEVSLNDTDKNYVISIWKNADWQKDTTKTDCPYCFIVDDTTKFYYSSEVGLFMDKENNLHFFVSKEQKTILDSIITDIITA